jgi:alkyl hydroperoxide reductase subunit AhpC
MALKLGDKAPNFKAQTTQGTIDFYEWMGNDWALFFSHPADFTPVCTTELGHVAKMKREFDRRGVKVIGLSVDTLSNHKKWLNDIEETQKVSLNYPVIADPNREVADLYGMIHTNGDHLLTTGRSVYVIDANKKIRLIITYPESTGRNFDEILRAIDSLQLTSDYEVATPVNWTRGDDVMILPSVSKELAMKRFPMGWKEQNSYIRVVPDPRR